MGFSSKQEPGGAPDWSQNLMNSGAVGFDPALQPAAAGGPARNQRQQHAAPLRCPRCHSTNTKFCYYNNYNRSQPRHLCKACRRHWTQGGTLRNVPVGGARKRKRSKPNSTTGSTTPVISQPLRPPSQFGGGRSNGCMFSDYLLPPSEFGFLGSVPLPAQFGGSSAGFSIFPPSPAQYYCWGQDANSGALPESAGGTGTGMDSWWSACWSSGWDDVDVAAGLVGPDVRRLTPDGSPWP